MRTELDIQQDIDKTIKEIDSLSNRLMEINKKRTELKRTLLKLKSELRYFNNKKNCQPGQWCLIRKNIHQK
ncbi:MAG: hypothetical protein DRP09_22070, partial [Candidatus Thorarchaeota archaeon]